MPEEAPPEHTPRRPDWICRDCHEPWPCPTRQTMLLDELRDRPVAVVLYLAELVYILVSMQRLESTGWSELLTSRGFIIAGWIGGPLYIGGQLWYALVQRKRLARLRALQAELVGPG